ncbi:MAG: ATP-binding protein [Methanoregulaceae archaeon]
MAHWTDELGLSRNDLHRIVILGAITLLVLAINFIGLESGISVVLPHLFYIPIILAAYWYPRYGLVFAVALSILYLGSSLLITQLSIYDLAFAGARAAIFIFVGGAVAWLATSLRKQEELYQGVFEHTLAMTFIARLKDGDGLIDEANSSAAMMFDPSHWIPSGTPLSRYWPDAGTREGFFAALREKGMIRNQEATFVTPAGKTLNILVSGQLLTGDLAILVAQDVTGQKRKDEALHAANEKLNNLSSLTRHDLLNAMTALLGEIDLGAMQFGNEPEKTVFGRLERAAQRVRRRIEMSRDYQDLGAKPAGWQNVQEILSESATRIRSGPVTFRAWTERLEIFADPLVRQAFHHLMENTVTHAKGATFFLVTYSIRDSGCEIFFRDNGQGIPGGKKAGLFTHKPGREDGMGLFLVKEIIGVTGLTIREEGEPGKGVLFVIHLPHDTFRVI